MKRNARETRAAAGRAPVTYFRYIDSPLGRMLLTATEAALTGVHFEGEKYFPDIEPGWHLGANVQPIAAAARQLEEYFAGRRQRFDLRLEPAGTDFQRAVWRTIGSVPFGRTMSYGELARKVGRPRAVRAAGAATGRNPISIMVPCHRIVGSDGSLTGYAGGLDRKRRLLQLEGITGR